MAFPLAGILPSAGGSQRYIVAFTARRLGMDSGAHLHPRSSFCLCLFNETDGKAGLAICLTNASADAGDIHLVFVPGQRK